MAQCGRARSERRRGLWEMSRNGRRGGEGQGQETAAGPPHENCSPELRPGISRRLGSRTLDSVAAQSRRASTHGGLPGAAAPSGSRSRAWLAALKHGTPVGVLGVGSAPLSDTVPPLEPNARMKTITRLSLLSVLLVPALSSAQVFEVGREREEARPRQSPVIGGGSLVYGRPTGSFADYVKEGFGVDGFARWKVDHRGILSLGLDGGWLQYGRETLRVPLSSTVGRILVDVTTSNNIAFLGGGPQLMVPVGPVRPYVNASLGFSYFFTQSSVEGSDNSAVSFAETTNFDDVVFTKTGGAGLYIPFGRRGGTGLDIGVRYHSSGNTEYLREDSIVDRPGQSPLINPIRSETKLLSWRIGIVAGLF